MDDKTNLGPVAHGFPDEDELTYLDRAMLFAQEPTNESRLDSASLWIAAAFHEPGDLHFPRLGRDEDSVVNGTHHDDLGSDAIVIPNDMHLSYTEPCKTDEICFGAVSASYVYHISQTY